VGGPIGVGVAGDPAGEQGEGVVNCGLTPPGMSGGSVWRLSQSLEADRWALWTVAMPRLERLAVDTRSGVERQSRLLGEHANRRNFGGANDRYCLRKDVCA
jgi:hypothetical protein